MGNMIKNTKSYKTMYKDIYVFVSYFFTHKQKNETKNVFKTVAVDDECLQENSDFRRWAINNVCAY